MRENTVNEGTGLAIEMTRDDTLIGIDIRTKIDEDRGLATGVEMARDLEVKNGVIGDELRTIIGTIQGSYRGAEALLRGEGGATAVLGGAEVGPRFD